MAFLSFWLNRLHFSREDPLEARNFA